MEQPRAPQLQLDPRRRRVHKASAAEIHANVGHLARDAEEQKISHTHVAILNGRQIVPQRRCCTRHRFPGIRVGIMHQAAAIKTTGRAATIAVGHAHLL